MIEHPFPPPGPDSFSFSDLSAAGIAEANEIFQNINEFMAYTSYLLLLQEEGSSALTPEVVESIGLGTSLPLVRFYDGFSYIYSALAQTFEQEEWSLASEAVLGCLEYSSSKEEELVSAILLYRDLPPLLSDSPLIGRALHTLEESEGALAVQHLLCSVVLAVCSVLLPFTQLASIRDLMKTVGGAVLAVHMMVPPAVEE